MAGSHPTGRRRQSRRPTEEELSALYKPGSIRRVRLRNFLTYSDVEFRPGPRLNVVMGPNGTGKSTLLCAICLGLGGEPPLLGRADDARTFIMHDADRAVVEVELSPLWKSDMSGPDVTHVIRRTIDRSRGTDRGKGRGASTYHLNGEECGRKEVQRIVSEVYHISVDNLCTFLPQDRVGSFSGFDGRSLLIETEKSLSGSGHIHDAHMKLIDLENEIRTSGSSVEDVRDRLKGLEEEHARLEREKELMEERREAEVRLKLLEQKRAWLMFDEQRGRAVDLKGVRDELKSNLKEARKTLRPLEDRIARLESDAERLRSRRETVDSEMRRAAKEHDKSMRKAETFADEIENEMSTLSSIDAMRRRAEKQVAAQRAKAEEMVERMADLPPEDEIEQQYQNATAQMRELRGRLTKAKRDSGAAASKLKDAREMHQKARAKLEKMNDDRARRNERIFRQNATLHQTYQWVDQNRKMFRRPIWGPIVCEIDTESPEAATFVEQHVPRRFLISYVAECDEDYNLLFREVREKRKLHINICKVPGGRLEQPKMLYSDTMMEMLKREHGVMGSLEEIIRCPDPVLQVLRNECSVHQVLVGNEVTQESIDRRGFLDQISKREDGRRQGSCVFTNHMGRSFKYTNTVSRYSGKTSLRVDDIQHAKMLAPGVTAEQKAELEGQVAALEGKIRDLEPEQEEASKLFYDLQSRGQEIQQALNEAKAAKANLKAHQAKLDASRRKLRELEESASRDNAAEKDSIIGKLRRHAVNSAGALENAAEQHTRLMEATYTLAGVKMTEDGLAVGARRAHDKLKDKQAESSSLDEQIQQATLDFNEAKKRMRELKAAADKVAPMTDELKAKLEGMPGDLHEVEAALEDMAHRIGAIADNPEVLLRYEERKREITAIKEELENLTEAKDAKRAQLESMRATWEEALENTVKEVDGLFGRYMKELGCAGEVRLARGEPGGSNGADPDAFNFKEWGIEIRVKFREKSSLQVLSARVQSGGERSVSTIMYLMALQELMVSPFRCVDEINQGLDERNERLVFKRIVENSTRPSKDAAVPFQHSGQYFLITPKLLPNLTDMENEDVTILCIFNGPHNFKHFSGWNVDKFLQQRKRDLTDGKDMEVEEEEDENDSEEKDEGADEENEEIPRKRGSSRKRRKGNV